MKRIIGIFGLALSLSIISCQKSEDFNVAQENLSEKSGQILVDEISVDNAIADIGFESDFYVGAEHLLMGMYNSGMHSGGMNNGGMNMGWNNSMRYRMGQQPGFNMHSEQGHYPDSMVMNYGMGTQLNNGRVMSGSMIFNTSEEPNGDGYTREMTFENFSVDSMSISGMVNMFITGDNQHGSSHMVNEDLMITMPDGKTIHRESKIVRTWISGTETDLNQMDDTMKVTGYVVNTITAVDGTISIYRKDITVPLIKTSDCRYFSAGTIAISFEGSAIASLNYGDGECDNVALLTNSDGTKEIVLSENDHCSNEQGNGMGMGNNVNGMGNQNNGNNQGTGMGNQNNGNNQGTGMGNQNNGNSQGTGMGNHNNGNGNGQGTGMGMGKGHGNG